MIEQMITLKNEADTSFLYLCPFLLLQTMDVVAVQNIFPFPIAVVHAQNMKQGRFPGAGWPHDRDELPLLDIKRNPTQQEQFTETALWYGFFYIM